MLNEQSVRRWLEEISQAAKCIEAEEDMKRARRELAYMSTGSKPEETVKCSIEPDKMKKIDNLLTYEEAADRRIRCHQATIDEALAIFEKMRAAGYREQQAANILECVHVQLLSKTKAARALRRGATACKNDYEYGIKKLAEILPDDFHAQETENA